MNFDKLIVQFGVYLSTYIACLVSGFLPLVNAEVFLVLVSAITPKSSAPLIILLATIGQMTAKATIYMAGRGSLKLPLKKYEQKMGKVIQKFEKKRMATNSFIFLSAFTGLPPFYIVSILAGVLKLKFLNFLICGFSGRLIRFSVVVLFPQLFKEIFK